MDTNVVKTGDLYRGKVCYEKGVGTRLGAIGRMAGGVLGMGGRTRVARMIKNLEKNWDGGDKEIDVVGFSRGSALAVHFVNKISEKGIDVEEGNVKPEIRFLGIWDLVASFGLSFDTFIDFQSINLGWDITSVPDTVKNCFHAMALHERRETFNVTRLNAEHDKANVEELWFRGVHSDIGGGNQNLKRSNIALQWMLEKAHACGVPINEAKSKLSIFSETDHSAPISENKDPVRDEPREILAGDEYHSSATASGLAVGESHVCRVLSKIQYNWSGVALEEGATYRFSVDEYDTWSDGSIKCGPGGWESEDLSWFKEKIVERMEKHRRVPEANWFELIGAIGDEDDKTFRLNEAAGGQEDVAENSGDLYFFANDLKSKYDNNDGDLWVTIERLS